MEDKLTIGSLIKRHIKMRGRTVKEVSEALGRNYTTFSGILNRDVVDAKLLFELANLLDMDLVWMAELFDHKKTISMFRIHSLTKLFFHMNGVWRQDRLKMEKNNFDVAQDRRAGRYFVRT